MANLMASWNISHSNNTVQDVLEKPVFDKKYKTIINCQYDDEYMEKINWINLNSKGSVDVKILTSTPPPKMFIAFEDDADALIFKIKYM